MYEIYLIDDQLSHEKYTSANVEQSMSAVRMNKVYNAHILLSIGTFWYYLYGLYCVFNPFHDWLHVISRFTALLDFVFVVFLISGRAMLHRAFTMDDKKPNKIWYLTRMSKKVW
jgi:hypothetical protein